MKRIRFERKEVACLLSALFLCGALLWVGTNHSHLVSGLTALSKRALPLSSQDEALLAAVKADNLKAVQVALQKGADINCQDRTRFRSCTSTPPISYYTPLIHSVMDSSQVRFARGGKPKKFVVMAYLLEHGADPNLDGSGGATALTFASGNGDDAAVQLLLEHGANPNGGSSERESALAEACYRDHLVIAKQLFAHGALLNSHGEVGCTPLHRAIGYRNNLEIARWLLESGADVNARNALGKTPLHNAVEYADLDAVKLLVAHGADVNATDVAGETSFDVARDYPTSSIARSQLGRSGGNSATEISAKMIAILREGAPAKVADLEVARNSPN